MFEQEIERKLKVRADQSEQQLKDLWKEVSLPTWLWTHVDACAVNFLKKSCRVDVCRLNKILNLQEHLNWDFDMLKLVNNYHLSKFLFHHNLCSFQLPIFRPVSHKLK